MDDPEDRCPTCGDRIPDGQGLPLTDYADEATGAGPYTRYFCSQECLIDPTRRKTWKVSFCLTVDVSWIDEGFDLTPALLKEVIQDGIVDYAYYGEKRVTDIVIREVQTPQRRKKETQ
jgi:hypothetical protein